MLKLKLRQEVKFRQIPLKTPNNAADAVMDNEYQAFEMIGASDLRDLIIKIKADYPSFTFKTGRKFAFRYPKTITIGPTEPSEKLLLLHELSHALLGHKSYSRDIDRVKMESEAWEKAKELANHYGVEIDENLIQDELDTYREWLHQKSRCPKCGLTRFQTPDSKYHCPRCENFA